MNIFQGDKVVKEYKEWTKWHEVLDAMGNVLGFYKTNKKRVMFKSCNGYKGESSCHKCDEFDLYFGLKLAMMRAELKQILDEEDKLNKLTKKHLEKCNKIQECKQELRAKICSFIGSQN